MDDNRNNQIAAASDLGGMTIEPDGTVRLKRRNPPLVDRNGLVIVPAVDGAHELYAAVDELTAWEARREAGRDGQ